MTYSLYDSKSLHVCLVCITLVQSLDVEKIECAFNDLLPLHDVKIDEYLTLTQIDEISYRLHEYCDTPLGQTVWTEAMSSCLLYFFDG